MPPTKKFENKYEIQREINIATTKIVTARKEIESIKVEISDVQWKKIGFREIITGDDNLTNKIAAQQNHEALCDKEDELCKEKENLQRKLPKLEERKKQLEEFKDEWTGPD